ncbi:uromodulin-like [Montipora capricornis]|uniref:uromodulin-like n=1 Tax=Montipora capricornis TaxID=246305 RepID=UPI0035F1E15E
MKKTLPLLLIVVTIFLKQRAIDASPQSGINQFCTQSEMFDVCGENMQCEKIGEIALCKCNPGYAPFGRLCKDINECKQKESRKECKTIGAICRNIPGSYECRCERGFKMGVEYCEDINECSYDKCDVKATCENTRGSFVCKCKEGYAGDGFQCIVDEVYEQEQKIKQIIIIGVSAAGGTLLIILLIVCCCFVKPKKKKNTKVETQLGVFGGQDWAPPESSGSSDDSE